MNSLSRSVVANRLAEPSGRAWEAYFDALARKSDGEDIILLSIGDPDFRTPAHIAEALQGSIRNQRTHYGPPAGEMALRQHIAEMESRNTNRRIEPQNVTISLGATGGIYSVLACIADPGNRIVVPEPMYTSYEVTVASAGLHIIPVPQPAPEFSVDPDSLLEAVDDQTVAILVNTPCNPTGHVIPAHVLEYLALECRKRNLWLISDEVYSLIYFDVPHMSLLRSTDCYDNIVVVDSLSKSHAMTGWRVGWTITPEHLAEDLARHICGINFGCSQFIQDAAEIALRASASNTLQMRREYRRRRDYVVKRINKLDGISCRTPAAGMFLMVHCDMHGDEFTAKLLDQAGISVFPGSAFGSVCEDYVRLSLTTELSELKRAMDRIEAWWNTPEARIQIFSDRFTEA